MIKLDIIVYNLRKIKISLIDNRIIVINRNLPNLNADTTASIAPRERYYGITSI